MCRRYLDGVIVIDDATILGGLRFAVERMKQVLEPAGAAAHRCGAVRPRSRSGTASGSASSRPAATSTSGGSGELLEAAAPLPGTGP